jgi:hypothetical protein
MSIMSRRLIIAGCLFGFLVPAARPEAIAEEPATAPSADDSAVLKRIFDNWRARQLRIKTLYFAWNIQSTPKGSTVPVIARRTELSMDDLRYRTVDWWNRQNAIGAKPDPSQQPELQKISEVAFDGPTSYRLDLVTKPPYGKVQDATGPHPWNECAKFPILLAYRPLSRGSAHFRVLSQNAIIGKTHCVKLQYRLAPSIENFWVDPAREDLVVAWEDGSGRNAATFLTIEYDRHATDGWIPARWTYISNPARKPTSGIVTRFALNESIPQDTFTVKFPPGTTVLDNTVLEKYIVAKDGSKSTVLKLDSPESLKIYESLDQNVEFLVDAEPLKDALDFIATRYGIKVTIDAQGVHDGAIDPSVEVQSINVGPKLSVVLRSLLQQSAKPLTYHVRKGELIIRSARK